MTILVTGAAGFIGYHLCEALLAEGERVIGIDSLNDYYDVRLKETRRDRLLRHNAYSFEHADIVPDVILANYDGRHELATPLSTIAVVTKELSRILQDANVSDSAIDDVALIRGEVDLCRSILNDERPVRLKLG